MTSSAIALVTAAPAMADLTAEQVIADQLRQMELYGLSATVSNQSRSGDTIIVEELSASGDLPEGSFRVTMGGASFTEMGDGTVEVTYPATIPVAFTGVGPDGEEFSMNLALTQSNLKMLVSGIPEEIRYDVSGDSVALSEINFDGMEDADEIDLDMNVQATGIAGTMTWIGGGTVRNYTSDFRVAGMTMDIAGADGDDGAFNLAFDVSDIAANYGGSAAPQELMASFADAIAAGNVTKGTASHGAMTYTVSGDGPDGTFEIAAAVASGDFDFDMGRTGMSYGTVSQDMTLSVGGDFMPLPPLTFKMAESGMEFAMPVVPSEEPQDFGLSLNLGGLEIDPLLWGMIDPTGQISRDPANLVIDLAGMATLSEDIFDPEFAEQMTGAPGELNALNVNQILLQLAGAELTGDGAFNFNNSGPVPMPAGTLNLMLKGGNGLLDTLVNMGLIPEEQAMGARMMMGMFAKPGTGPDTLVSTIELKEDGAVLANGQRIR